MSRSPPRTSSGSPRAVSSTRARAATRAHCRTGHRGPAVVLHRLAVDPLRRGLGAGLRALLEPARPAAGPARGGLLDHRSTDSRPAAGDSAVATGQRVAGLEFPDRDDQCLRVVAHQPRDLLLISASAIVRPTVFYCDY